jgi:hypothetical protein
LMVVLGIAVGYIGVMISLKRVSAGLMSLLVVTADGFANEPGADDRNYRVIVERNPFGLKPPPPPPTNAPVAAAPKDEILLTGMTSLGGLRAYFQSKAPQGKQPEFYSLGVDEKKDGLEVLAIDLANKSVRVRNGGAESLMTFASNGVKPPATPVAPVMAPGLPQPPGAMTTPGGVNVPGGVNRAGGNAAVPPMTGGAISAGTPATTTSGRIRTIPSRNVRTPPAMQQQPAVDMNQQPVAPDPNAAVQDVLLMELQKRANPDIPFPPTPLPQ